MSNTYVKRKIVLPAVVLLPTEEGYNFKVALFRIISMHIGTF